MEQRWALTVDESLPGGSRSYVARVRLADGQEAVLKLAVPDYRFAEQVRTLQLADGRGYVRVLAADVDRHAVLMEPLGPALGRLGLPPEAQLAVLVATLRVAWQLPRPADTTLPRAQARAHEVAESVAQLWEDLGRPCPEPVVARALEYAQGRAAATELDRAVLVHGDPHPANAMPVRAPRPGAESGYVLVDPNGFLADPAYDLGVALRDWCPQLLAARDAAALARRYCRLLAARSGLDGAPIWEWGYLERVSSGLYVLAYGAEDHARPFLDTAALLADLPGHAGADGKETRAGPWPQPGQSVLTRCRTRRRGSGAGRPSSTGGALRGTPRHGCRCAYDWDSLIADAEPVIAGYAAGVHADTSRTGPSAPEPAEVAAFLTDYADRRPAAFTVGGRACVAAAAAWALAYKGPLPAQPTLTRPTPAPAVLTHCARVRRPPPPQPALVTKRD